jgi:hypothetical protein
MQLDDVGITPSASAAAAGVTEREQHKRAGCEVFWQLTPLGPCEC